MLVDILHSQRMEVGVSGRAGQCALCHVMGDREHGTEPVTTRGPLGMELTVRAKQDRLTTAMMNPVQVSVKYFL